ncbi:MAG: carboxylate-amine ligase [Alphaproteobacteria bacterium]
MGTYGQPLTIGIEEEYWLVDPLTRNLARDPPPDLPARCAARIGPEIGAVTPEFLRVQLEVGTAICRSVKEARSKLAALRRCAIETAAEHGLALVAASTHPIADWDGQRHTDKDRYNRLAADMQALSRRLLICGMHVHVGIEDDDLRIDLINQVAYFLPHLLALSTSSPFWRGHDTGLKCYRLAVFDEMPRSGLPEQFASFEDYRRQVDALVKVGIIEDASKIWWDIRPHWRFPTLEMRIPDICTRLDDGIAVAALFVCLLSMLLRLRRDNQRWRVYPTLLLRENRWRAQRHGCDEGLVDFGKGRIVPYPALLEEILALVAEDAAALDCTAEVDATRDILARGTSAHRQVAIFDAARAAGADSQEALSAVVDWLIAETRHGL